MRLCRRAPLAAALLFAMPASAGLVQHFTVNSPGDAPDANTSDNICQTATPGVCTLRAAVAQANQTNDALITIPAIMITLTLGKIDLNRGMTIQGAGTHATVVSANEASRIFQISTSGNVSILDMTLQAGRVALGEGGLILALSTPLTVTRCHFVNGHAQSAGAIFVTGSSFLSMTDSTVTACVATSGIGGGIFFDSNATGALTRSTVNGNYASQSGGGIYTHSPSLDLLNCTLSGNHANAASGGGIGVGTGTLRLYNTTVVGNLSGAPGSGIAKAQSSTASLASSIVASNSRGEVGSFTIPDDCSGAFTSGGGTIVKTVIGAQCTITGAYSAVDPLLGALADNGGLTKTHASLSGSPAIEGGAAGGCTDKNGALITKDQRGVARPIGAKCDSGAYERSPCGDVNGDGAVSVLDVFFLINHLFAGGPVPPGLANMNGDGTRSVLDVFHLINSLFAAGPAPVCPGT
jgi:CSLREA domain-containing protein